MRILFEHPIYSSDKLTGISMFNMYRSVVQGCRKIGQPLVAYYAAPRLTKRPWEKKTPIEWTDAEMRDFGFIPLPIGGGKFAINVLYTKLEPEFINLFRDQSFCADAAWIGTYVDALSLQIQQHAPMSRWVIPQQLPIINYWTETTIDRALGPMSTDEVAGTIAMGAAAVPTAVMNSFDLKDLNRITSKYLSPSMKLKAMSQAFIVPPAFDASKIDSKFEFYERSRATNLIGDSVTIFHGGSKESKRHVDDLVSAVELVRQWGANVSVHLTTQGKIEFDKPWVTVKSDCNGDDYINSFGEGDFLWMMADYEGTGIGYMEAVRSGMMPICNSKALWVKDRVPKDYPVWVENPGNHEAVAKLLFALWKGKNQLKSQWQAKLIASMDPWSDVAVAKAFINGTHASIKEPKKANEELVKSNFGYQFLLKAVEKGDLPERVDLDGARAAMTRNTDSAMPFDWIPNRALRTMLETVGWNDTYEEQLVFAK
jgi:hypothetical protein